MTSLYKRYIPPKPAAAPSIASTSVPQPIISPEPPKRKRERSEEEVAERKAKKAKKKGAPVEDVAKTVGGGIAHSAAVEPIEVEAATRPRPEIVPETPLGDQPKVLEAGTVPLPDVEAVEEAAATGDFSHVKNKKKRHKLEKEARKARKAAEKGGGSDANVEAQNVEETVVEDGEDAGIEDIDVVEIERAQETIDEADEVAVEAEEQPVKAKAKTKKVKRKEAVVDNDGEGGDILPKPTSSAYNEEMPQPKKRRHKLEAVLTESNPHQAEDDNDDEVHLRKHGAIINNFQKASKRAQAMQSHPRDEDEAAKESIQPVVDDLEMPDADLPPHKGDDENEEELESNLPAWLVTPTIISADSKATFASLHLAPKILTHLSALRFEDALPVQQALIPLLLPPGTAGSAYLAGTDLILPDLAVSAATGSGKTLAYLLPILESLKLRSVRGRLTALVVVPTRELVQQVAAVAESLAKGSGLKVGMATGSGKFMDEQKRIIKREFQYKPGSVDATADEDLDLAAGISEGLLDCPPNHKLTHDSAVDILVATPGRLLEHVEHTQGFSLVHLQWLVLDEADKLLDHQSARDISSLLQHISRPRTAEEQDARERFLKQRGEWDNRSERRARKILLSATMTRDVQRLADLELRFPRLIAVQQEVDESKSGFEVPTGLEEYVVPVGDGSEKPLVALEWLRTRIFGEKDEGEEITESSESGSDSGSESDSDSASSSSSTTIHEEDHISPLSIGRTAPPTVLVFTATSESASRLSHLLRALKPDWDRSILVLTKAQKSLPRSSLSSGPLIVVSTDRAARGLDSLSGRPISHVLQYDVPTSLTNYIHRVGRTARNGRDGEAWTLFGRREAAWFLKVVGVEQGGEGEGIKRKGLVERVKVFMKDEHIRERYAEVLGEMRGEVLGGAKAE